LRLSHIAQRSEFKGATLRDAISELQPQEAMVPARCWHSRRRTSIDHANDLQQQRCRDESVTLERRESTAALSLLRELREVGIENVRHRQVVPLRNDTHATDFRAPDWFR
jgi:hypothetical protein